MKKNLILGIGNLILGDEGVGIHAVRELQKMDLPPDVDILDGGTAGLVLMETMQDYERVIIIDAAVDRNPTGSIRHIIPKFSGDYPPLITIHEIGLKDVIEAMCLTGYSPVIEMIIVSVKKFDEVSMELSPEIKRIMPKIIDKVFQII